MFECKEYKKRKLRGWSERVEESETDAENWERFVGVAREGREYTSEHPSISAPCRWEQTDAYGTVIDNNVPE